MLRAQCECPAADAPPSGPRGRPCRVEGTRSTCRVELRLTDAEAGRLRTVARRCGLSLADLLRLAILDLANDIGDRELCTATILRRRDNGSAVRRAPAPLSLAMPGAADERS